MSKEVEWATERMREASRKVESWSDWKKESLRSQVSALGTPQSPEPGAAVADRSKVSSS
jgi:hypothetical protein